MNTSPRKNEHGSAIAISMLVIFLIGVGIAIAMQLTTGTLRNTDHSRDFSALRSAAEGALEFAYGVWVQKMNNKFDAPKQSDLDGILTPSPSFGEFSAEGPLQIQPTDAYGQPANDRTLVQVNLDKFPGWMGRNYGYLASVQLSGTFAGNRKVKYGVKRTINYSVVPLFQATAFFEGDLELYRTAPMTIGGLVHTNSRAFVSSQVNPNSGNPASLTFTGNLSHAGGYIDGKWTQTLPNGNQIVRDAPPEAWNWSGYVPNNSFRPDFSNGGYDEQVHQVDRLEPLGADSDKLLHPPVNPNGTSTGDTNPNDDSMRELIEPPDSAKPDPTPIAERRLYNKAGIRVRISGSSSNPTVTITTHNGTTLNSSQKSKISGALSQQTIYDRREGKNIDLTSFDISKARSTLNGANGFNDIIYIDDVRSTGYNDPKGIRLVNGEQLPSSGLTVATQNPVYIQGDYNTSGSRVPSAVFADAVTILSNAWQDSKSSSGLSSRNASNTTVNTAIVAGFLPSGWKNPVTGVLNEYSGGLNNFPRFLEDWSNNTFAYTGSMIELFTSEIATGVWDTGSIYSPPDRNWNFDSNFIENPPPGSLTGVSAGRGALVRF